MKSGFFPWLDFVREGDTVYIKDFSRLARSTKDLLNITKKLETQGVKLISLKESLDTSTATGKLMLTYGPYKNRTISGNEAIARLNLKRNTFYKFVNEEKVQSK
ncbi:MAG: recombinase family protein [Defluviitaleaceae bacterium]|nr:recombinase family protein [Defluviitaleaceae bacterium]